MDDLFIYTESGTQTDLSFASKPIYETFLTSNSELFMIWKKIIFSKKLSKMIKDNKNLNYVRNEKVLDFMVETLNKEDVEEGEDFMDDQGNFMDSEFEVNLNELIDNYAFEAEKRMKLKYDNQGLKKTHKALAQRCRELKWALMELDENFSKKINKSRAFFENF